MSERWGAEDVTVAFGPRSVLSGVTLTVSPGQVVAVVGGDGAGKTTLLRTLTGRVVPAAGHISAPPLTQIGYQPATSGTWAQLTVDENLQLVAGAYRMDPTTFRARADRLLEAAGLVVARGRLAAHLSGGMRQKLGFCMAMLHAPRLLVLDEPSTGVDPVSRVELWSLLAEAAADGAAVVLSTTYLDEAERVHDVLVLDEGVPLLQGTPQHILASAPGTVTAVLVPTDPTRAWRRGTAWRQWHAGPPNDGDVVVTPDMEDAVVAAALGSRPADLLPPIARPPAGSFPDKGKPLATTDSVTRRFGSEVAVDNVTTSVRSGEIVALIGANGAGKTTLIRMQLGLVLPTSGRVSLFDEEPSRTSRRRLGYVPQGLGLYRDLTVAENVAFVARAYGNKPELDEDLTTVKDELVGDIGLGRQRQLAFSCALSHQPELLLLDEPTSGVDPISRARLWDTIHEQADAGVGVLVSTHYMQEAEQCDRLVLMNLGRVVAEGTVADIVGATTAVRVETDDWSGAFAALTNASLPVALSGTQVRVADTDPGEVLATVSKAGITATIEVVPATLEETMTVIARRGTRR